MINLTREMFIALGNNKLLNESAKKWGFRLGAEQFVGGVGVDSVMRTVKTLNQKGISCTVDQLGEFITNKPEAIVAKKRILELLERIHDEKVDCHISIKLTQLGLDITEEFCLENVRDILDLASAYHIFVNIDMEDYLHYPESLHIVDALLKEYRNVGTVIQSYLYRAEPDMERLQDVRLRIVKGAYQESPEVAYQSKEMIDYQFLNLAKQRLKGEAFTSIATHDHHLIEEIKQFIAEEGIDRNKFEFQMLYGFRTEMQEALAKEGYPFCTYIPFGHDWYGYFMRRLAERPQNVSLLIKDKLYTEDNRIKKTPLLVAGAAVAASVFLLCHRKSK